MKRREIIALLGGAAVGLPLATRGQAEATRRIGALIAFAKDDPETEERLAGFQQGLAKRGWVEGRNIHIDYRFAAGRADPFPVLAKELVALQPDVILGHTPGAIHALQRETRTIPIVFVNVSDPIGMGFIASLPRPGGNITGVLHYEATIIGKWLAMLRAAPDRCGAAGQPKSEFLSVLPAIRRSHGALARDRSNGQSRSNGRRHRARHRGVGA